MNERYEVWRERVEKELGSADFEQELVNEVPAGVPGGLRVEPLYAPDHPSPQPPIALGLPGQPPYTRGGRLPRARDEAAGGASWSCCSRYVNRDLAEFNREIVADLTGGIDCLWLEVSAAPVGQGQTGQGQVEPGPTGRRTPIATIGDLDRLLSGVLPQAITTIFDGGADVLPAAALLLAWLDEHGFDPADLDLRFAADPLGSLAQEGRLPATLAEIDAEAAALACYCDSSLPRSRALTVSTLPYHDGGAHPAQELACGMATLLHYLRLLTENGLSLASAARQIELRVAVDQDLFVEISKLRALRTLWSKVLAACGDPAPPAPFVHAVASRRTLSRRARWMNLLRGTGEVVAAVVAGAERITNVGYEEAFANPSERSRRIARNTHTILAEESHLGEIADPAGGSYYVEVLSDRIARDAWARLQEIERRGGMAECLRAGFIQEEVAKSWEGRLGAIARRRQVMTGVSEFAQLDEEPIDRSGKETATATKKASAEGETPAEIDLPANPDRRLASLVTAARAGASLTELAGTLPRGEPQTAKAIASRRDAQPYERLRDAADKLARAGRRPSVFLACLGPLAEHKDRSSFARRAFAAGGLAAVEGSIVEETEPQGVAARLAGEFARSGAAVVAICGSDAAYALHLPSLVAALGEAGAQRIVLVAKPDLEEDSRRRAAIDHFLHPGCDLLELLADSLQGCEAGATPPRTAEES